VWCDTVCRSHGLATVLTPGLWACRDTPPPLYPDAVTLLPTTSSAQVLKVVGDRLTASAKDSAATLDLSSAGFGIRFEAQWIHRRPAPRREPLPPGVQSCSTIETAAGLSEWAAAQGTPEVFRPELLNDPAVRILVAHDGDRVGAGAIANRSDTVVGISNVFTTTLDPSWVWTTFVHVVAHWAQDMPLVGYERDADLVAAQRAGFEAVGPLRVWVRPA